MTRSRAAELGRCDYASGHPSLYKFALFRVQFVSVALPVKKKLGLNLRSNHTNLQHGTILLWQIIPPWFVSAFRFVGKAPDQAYRIANIGYRAYFVPREGIPVHCHLTLPNNGTMVVRVSRTGPAPTGRGEGWQVCEVCPGSGLARMNVSSEDA